MTERNQEKDHFTHFYAKKKYTYERYYTCSFGAVEVNAYFFKYIISNAEVVIFVSYHKKAIICSLLTAQTFMTAQYCRIAEFFVHVYYQSRLCTKNWLP